MEPRSNFPVYIPESLDPYFKTDTEIDPVTQNVVITVRFTIISRESILGRNLDTARFSKLILADVERAQKRKLLHSLIKLLQPLM